MHGNNVKSSGISEAIMALIAIQERHAIAIEAIAESLKDRVDTSPPPEVTGEAQAIAILFDSGETNVTKIAELVGVDRRSLYRWERFMHYRNLIKVSGEMTTREADCSRAIFGGDHYDDGGRDPR